jgi:hypothetical protein
MEQQTWELRQRVLASLSAQGLAGTCSNLGCDAPEPKSRLRELHRPAVEHKLAKARAGLERHEKFLLQRIASGLEIEPERMLPRLVEVKPDSEDELLFRYVRLHWSIPVSSGYGRRLRFLLVDDWNEKLIGIIGLGDPVYALGPRDHWIGWSADAKRGRIGSVMDAFVLGAVPPYNLILGGKLVALALRSAEVIQAFRDKYGERESLIRNVRPSAGLALVTTTSALGRSSLYNRLRIGSELVFYSVGYTKGSGEFQFATDLYSELFRLVQENSEPSAKHHAWGSGFRSKREVVLKALSILGLPRHLIYHGIKREVFVVPLASNSREYLQGVDQDLQASDKSLDEISTFCKNRWIVPRSSRDARYRDFRVADYALWNQ